MQIIDGKAISTVVKNELAGEVKKLNELGISVCLAVIIVGEDNASKIYVGHKKKACEYLGIISKEYALPHDTTEQDLIKLIDQLNQDPEVNGILCQLPLPKHINETKVIEKIDSVKDVDAFSYKNVGQIMVGDFNFLPCTPAGVMELLRYEAIDLTGMNCVVIGRSNIVGKPMAMLLLHKNATVTICHSKTVDLAKVCSQADLIVAAIGKAKFITADMVKPGAIVIDVGMNRDENNKLCGDVDYEYVSKKASYITPVPGGVGPMTIAMLMKNAITAAKLQYKSITHN